MTDNEQGHMRLKDEYETRKPNRLQEALERPGHLPVIDATGAFAAFTLRGLAGFRKLPGYTAEVLRQIGLLVAGSVLVIIFISFIAGASCGIAAEAIGQAVGAGIVGPLFSSFCVNREIVPFIFGFIVAAKVGGGIVSQLGAMRVNEEVDAMETMGVPSMVYLVSTRMLAAMIVMPICYLISLGAAEGAAWIGSYVRSGTLSQGTWEFVFYTVTNLTDILYSVIKGMVITASVVLVALFFGYRVSGGPGRGRHRHRSVDGGEPDPGDDPQHDDDVPVLGLRPSIADRMSALRRRIGPHATRVVVVSALVLGAFVLVWAITSSSRGAYEMKAEFDDVRGLIPGGEVRAGAVPVGEVTSVESERGRRSDSSPSPSRTTSRSTRARPPTSAWARTSARSTGRSS